MLNYFSGKVVAVLVPVLTFVWIVLTVMALHRRDVYFWSLGSTWTSIIACPIALVIMSLSTTSQLHDASAPVFQVPIMEHPFTLQRSRSRSSITLQPRDRRCWP